ncbi:MAG TPA: YihY/virulence factor BrkB family protein, partial [Gammaproteobacteria bacterium]|nr:YihY/virulence factor BrkB family protein [Gammaproteobacteria bacterium]
FQSAKGFYSNDAFQLAAAIAYYSLLSMAPLLLIVVSIAGVFFADGLVHTKLIEQMHGLIGAEGAQLTETVIRNTGSEEQSRLSLILGSALTLFGATTVFSQLQTALNRVWHVEAEPSNAIWNFVRHRLLSFALVLSIGFLLMVSLVTSALLAAAHEYMNSAVSGAAFLWAVLDLGMSLGLATVLIGLMFKYLPDAEVQWRDTWLGGFVTSILFVAGKSAIGLYLGQASVASSFGAAGSVVVFMIWVYYASLIVLFGAEITHAVAHNRGAKVVPSQHAHPASEAAHS